MVGVTEEKLDLNFKQPTSKNKRQTALSMPVWK